MGKQEVLSPLSARHFLRRRSIMKPKELIAEAISLLVDDVFAQIRKRFAG